MAWGAEKSKKLTVPSCPDDKGDEGHFHVDLIEEKIVRDFTGYDFDRMENLTVFEFWLFLRDAVVYNLQQTEDGRKYLEKCWCSEQTKPDRAALRRQFGK